MKFAIAKSASQSRPALHLPGQGEFRSNLNPLRRPQLQTRQAHLTALLQRDTIQGGYLIVLAVGVAVSILIVAIFRGDNVLMALELCLLIPPLRFRPRCRQYYP